MIVLCDHCIYPKSVGNLSNILETKPERTKEIKKRGRRPRVVMSDNEEEESKKNHQGET